VGFLFAGFGQFLHKAAPPAEGGTSFAVGMSSVLVLCAFLYISALSKNLPRKSFKVRWLSAAACFFVIAVCAAPFYYFSLLRSTFHFPDEASREIYTGGTSYTPQAEQYRRAHPNISIQELVLDFGGIEARHRIWTPESMRSVKLKLTSLYIVLALSLAAGIFCLTEGVLTRPNAG
jgi:hypothetical protein